MIMMDLSMADSLDVGKEAAAAAKPAAAGAVRGGPSEARGARLRGANRATDLI